MKTTTKLKGFLALACVLFLFNSGLRAQCSSIANSLNCNVTVDVNIYSLNQFHQCVFCQNVSGMVISSGATVPILCNPCVNVCNVEVIVTNIGGGSIGTNSTDFNNPGPNSLSGVPPDCSASAVIEYHPNMFKIHP